MNIIHSILIVIETVILTLSSAIAEVPVQKEVTLKEASKACTLNDGKNCNRLGNLFYKGEGVEKSNLKAVEFFSKACGFNSPSGCGSLAERFYNGEGIEKSYPKAFEYYTKACGLNSGWSCDKLAMMFAKGEGVEKSTTKADEYFAKACKLGNIADCKSAVKVKPEREQPLSKK